MQYTTNNSLQQISRSGHYTQEILILHTSISKLHKELWQHHVLDSCTSYFTKNNRLDMRISCTEAR